MQTRSGPSVPSFAGRFLSIPVTLILALLVSGTGWTADQGEPVVRVNGVTLYQSDLSCTIEAAMARKLSSRHTGDENPDPEGRRVDRENILNRLVNIELLYQESLKHRFHSLAEESEERYQREVKRLGGESKLASTLQCNNMTTEQFRKAIFRSLSIKRLLDEVVYSRIKVTRDEARAYYEEHKIRFRKPKTVRIRQILIKGPSKPKSEKWSQVEDHANTVYRDASSGADFVRLARRHSEDPASASVGGDMGSIQKGNLQDIFGTVIFTFKPGAVTKPIRSQQGFHIIKIVSVNPSRTRSFDEVQRSITTMIRRERAREMITQLIEDLKEKAEIEIIKTK